MNPTMAVLDECDKKAQEAFENAGGRAGDFERQKREAAMGALSGSMEACIKAKAVDATAPTVSEVSACETEAQQSFVQAGGDATGFARARMEGAASAAGSAMESCSKMEIETLGLAAGTRPSHTQMRTIHDKCDASAKADFIASGGDEFNFKLSILAGATHGIADTFETCLESSATDVTSPTEAELDACAVKAKDAFENAGGDPGDFERRQAGAAASSLATTIEVCLKDTANPDSATDAERQACADKGRTNFAKAGGDLKHFDLAKRNGARGTATEVLQSCITTAAAAKVRMTAAVTTTATTVRMTAAVPDATAVATCRESAKKAFIQAGGSAANYDRVQDAGARDAMMEKMEVCAETKIAELNLAAGAEASADATEKAFNDCNEDTKTYFLQNGGDPAAYQEEMAEGARDMVSDVMSTCMESAAGATPTAAEISACETKAMALAASLGDPPQRFQRTKQEGARKALSSTLETCRAAATTDTAKSACTETAKASFAAAGGDAASFEKEQRLGAGKVAGDQLKSCLKNAANTAAEDSCQGAAKEAHANAGGDTKNYWYDAKKGLMTDTVTFNSICLSNPSKDSTACAIDSKTYFTDVLKGSASDWNEADFATAVELSDTPTTTREISSVDARFTFDIPMVGAATLSSKKGELETAITSAASATSTKCGDASAVGSVVAVVCRINLPTQNEATTVEAAARNGDYSADVGTAASARRLGSKMRRTLVAVDPPAQPTLTVSDVDSSTVLQEYATTAVVTDATRVFVTPAPTPAPFSTDTVLSSAQGSFSPLNSLVLALAAAAATMTAVPWWANL
jgi:hypothetical protein